MECVKAIPVHREVSTIAKIGYQLSHPILSKYYPTRLHIESAYACR